MRCGAVQEPRYVVANLMPMTKYRFRVTTVTNVRRHHAMRRDSAGPTQRRVRRASPQVGESAPSKVVTVSTKTRALQAPTNLRASARAASPRTDTLRSVTHPALHAACACARARV